MSRPKPLLVVGAAAVAVAIAACGTKTINADNAQPLSPVHQGAVLFSQRCGGCHTLERRRHARARCHRARSTQQERTDGPNLDYRKESVQDVLFAIRNGGFSGSIMPANVVVGPDAQKVALFVSKYAGSKASSVK